MPRDLIIDYSTAVAEATRQAMLADPRVIVMGEGVTDPKAIFGTTAGLLAEFGSERVIETPVAENGLTGIAIGAAISGLRPILIHQRVEFALLSIEQIFNNAAKTHYVTNGTHKVPLVIRLIVGRGWGQGPMHSQSLEALFAHIPGLKVIVPATAGDAKGMLLSAIQDDNPVVMIEHRWCHYALGEVSEDPVPGDIKHSAIRRPGKDVTIASLSYPLFEALQAAEIASGFGIEAEVVDLRVLRPFSNEKVLASVEKTGRLITLDLGWVHFGIGAEVIAQVSEHAVGSLKENPVRLGLADHPTPSSRSLAESYYPTCEDILTAICKTMHLANNVLNDMIAAWHEVRPDTPIDVPNPDFKGPF